MDNLTLRDAGPDDSEFAYRVKKAAFKENVEKVWGWNEEEQRQLHKNRFEAQDFRIINLGGIDVGVLAMVISPDCIKVNQLFLLPEYQSKGIGRSCMQLIIDKALEMDLPIRLQVLKVNPRAQAFFLRLGFLTIGETNTHILLERPSGKS
jgi:N-acetylglutamate synthase-like GNAT family acetyltransferase